MKYPFRLFALAVVLGVFGSIVPLLAQPLTFDQATTCASGDGYFGWGPSKLVVDAQGNTYVAGRFNGAIVLGNSLLSATQTYAGNTIPGDVFVAKLDVAGNYLWAVQLGDNQSATVGGLAVDAAGDVYLTGGFTSYSLRVEAGGPQLFNSSASSEAFVAKLSGTTGQALWARRAGGTGSDYFGDVAINAAGEAYVLGTSGSPVADVGAFTLANPQNFIAKISPGGTWLWVRQAGSQPVGSAVPYSMMVLDSQGNIYVGGVFAAPFISFGTTTLSTQVVPGSPRGGASIPNELFVAKMSDTGAWLWAVQADAVTQQNLLGFGSMALDGAGHLYVAGDYESTAARIGTTVLPNLSLARPQPNPPPPTPYTNNYDPDAFVARLNIATGAWDWAVRNGGTGNEGARFVAADPQSRVYVTGSFSNTTPGGPNLPFAQLDGGTGAWRSFQSFGLIRILDMKIDGQSRLQWAGFFNGATAQFGSVTLAQAGPGRQTGFVARMSAGPLANRAAAGWGTALTVWPNPAVGGAVQVQGPAAGQVVQVFDVLGRLVAGERMPATGPLRWSLALPTGVYVVRAGSQARRLVIEL